MGSTYSNWSEILRGIPKGSMLGPLLSKILYRVPYIKSLLLFNIFVKDIFFFIEKSEICSFTDDNTLYSCDRNLLCNKENLICNMRNILFWFTTNSLKPNAGKFQFVILNRKNHRRQRMVINSLSKKVVSDAPSITIDNRLAFKKHIENLCRTAQYKLHVLARIKKKSYSR